MFKITDDNYEHYKKIFDALWQFKATRLIHVQPDVEYSPVIILTKWENKSKSFAKRGLKEALRDILTMLLDLPNDIKTELSFHLMNKGLPSFNQLAATIKDTPQKVLKRANIKNLDEYYIIKEFLNDPTSDISIADRLLLEKIFSDFENNYSNNKKNDN